MPCINKEEEKKEEKKCCQDKRLGKCVACRKDRGDIKDRGRRRGWDVKLNAWGGGSD